MLGTVLLSFQFQWEIVLLLLFLKLTILYTVIWTSAKKLDEKDVVFVKKILTQKEELEFSKFLKERKIIKAKKKLVKA